MHNKQKYLNYFRTMKLIIFLTLFLFSTVGLADNSYTGTLNSKPDLEIEIDESNFEFDNQLFSNFNHRRSFNKKRFKKRKNFVIGAGYNYYLNSKEKENLSLVSTKLNNYPCLNIGSILFDHFYVGIEYSSREVGFVEARIYNPNLDNYFSSRSINLYLSAKAGDDIEKYAVGYDYFVHENFSINTEVVYYFYSKSGSTNHISFGPANDWEILPPIYVRKTYYHESHSDMQFSMKIQFHF